MHFQKLRKTEYQLGIKAILWLFASLSILLGLLTWQVTGEPVRGVVFTFLVALYEILAVAFFLAVHIVVIAIHELGHLVFAKWTKFKCYGFRVGIFEVSNLTTGRRIRKTDSLTSGGGAVIAASETSQDIVKRYRWLLVGGPLFSILYAAANLAVWRAVSGGQRWDDSKWLFQPDRLYQFVIHLPLIFGLYSCFVVACSVIPYTYKGISSDARQLIDSFRMRSDLEITLTYMMVMIPWTYGVRARNWSREAIDFLVQNAKQPAYLATAHLLAYYNSLDSGNQGIALGHLNAAVEIAKGVPDNERIAYDGILFEAAYARAHYEHDPEAARALVDLTAQEQDATKYNVKNRTMAAILWSEGKHDEAKEAAHEAFQDFYKHYPTPLEDNAILELELIKQTVEPPLSEPISSES